MVELVEKMLAGNQQALARIITLVEREAPEASEIMGLIYPYIGKAYYIGFTGPPGGGKSTMVDKITSIMRRKGLSVGIVAVDPTSPFSGGALLGDRVRMQQHYLDDGVFIRSLATRGSHGGLPRTARSVIKLLDAFGKDIVLVETVGVGQTELDIMETVDTTVVVLVPEAGDTIQTMKAGLLEIADIFAVNKADHSGADYLIAELEAMLHQSQRQSWWQVPVIATQAINDIGTEGLSQQIEKHRQLLEQTGRLALKRREQRKKELIDMVERGVTTWLWELIEKDGRLKSYLEKVEEGELDPHSVATDILNNKDLVESWLQELRRK